MRRSIHVLLSSLGLLLLMAATSQVAARDHSGSHHSRSYGSHSSYAYPRYSHGGSRYNHHYHYPARGYSTYHLPHGYYTSRYYGSPYYYHGGSWYRPYGPRYVVVAPPFGIGISVLPPYYSTVWFGGSPYYYADNTYYTYRAERREYVVTEPPRGETSDEVFVYPKEGQSEEQQSTDRDQCHQWAVARTGFDPAQSPDNVAHTSRTSTRADYRRAEAACLEGRGYSVR